jgi:hypothetical protein
VSDGAGHSFTVSQLQGDVIPLHGKSSVITNIFLRQIDLSSKYSQGLNNKKDSDQMFEQFFLQCIESTAIDGGN